MKKYCINCSRTYKNMKLKVCSYCGCDELHTLNKDGTISIILPISEQLEFKLREEAKAYYGKLKVSEKQFTKYVSAKVIGEIVGTSKITEDQEKLLLAKITRQRIERNEYVFEGFPLDQCKYMASTMTKKELVDNAMLSTEEWLRKFRTADELRRALILDEIEYYQKNISFIVKLAKANGMTELKDLIRVKHRRYWNKMTLEELREEI